MSLSDSDDSHAQYLESGIINVHKNAPPSHQGGYLSDVRASLFGHSRPIDKLPFEVLAAIFSWCCPTFNDHYRGPPLSPVMLSHVCRSWRQAALDNPSLWTYLNLTVAYSSVGGMEKACDQLRLWVERASDCPLLVEVEFVESSQRWPAANVFYDMERLVNVALTYKPSLFSEGMELRAALDATSVSPPSPGNYPQVMEQYTWAKAGIRPDRPLRGSVQIHSNRHSEIMFGLEGHHTIGKHLIHLDLRDPGDKIRLSVEECQIALSDFPDLEFCALRIGESTDEVAEPLVLWRLQTLSLSWSDRVEVGDLLDSITAPSLSELELRGPLFPREFYPGNRWTHLPVLLRRSSPSLKLLTLANMDGTTVELLRCLALCQGLQHLSLESCRLDEEIMNSIEFGEGLTHERARRTILGLDYLGLISCEVFGLNDFLRVSLETPFWEEANLSKLYIINSGFISEDVLSAITRLPLDEFETDPALLEDLV
ncbi:hypothetical protein ACEPAF_1649 [Sanghuangporus sanghuang]